MSLNLVSKFELNQTAFYFSPKTGEQIAKFVIVGGFYFTPPAKVKEDGKEPAVVPAPQLVLFDGNGKGYPESNCYHTKEEVEEQFKIHLEKLISTN